MKLFSFVIFTFFLVPAFAHEGHNHEASVEPAPQGGILRDALPFKSEIILDKDKVKLYIYDEKLKVVKFDQPELKGDVQFPKESSRPVTFFRKNEEKPRTIVSVGEITERYEALIPKIDKVHRYDMHVNIVVGKKTAKADFGVDNIH